MGWMHAYASTPPAEVHSADPIINRSKILSLNKLKPHTAGKEKPHSSTASHNHGH